MIKIKKNLIWSSIYSLVFGCNTEGPLNAGLGTTYLDWDLSSQNIQKETEKYIYFKDKTFILIKFLMWTLLCNVQVNLFQKPSFLHQLNNNMKRDCSLNFPKKLKFRTSYVQKLFFCFDIKNNICTQCVLVFWGGFNEQSFVILWVNWLKNESFWHRFTWDKR